MKPVAQAGANVVLSQRDNGVIFAVETQNTAGYVAFNGEYTDSLSGKKYKGKAEVKPFRVLVLKI